MTHQPITIQYHQRDIPESVIKGNALAIDTEATGLSMSRDRLCLVQLTGGDGIVHLIHHPNKQSRNLIALLQDKTKEKIFHYARFDMAMIEKDLGVQCQPIFCTKIASKLVRTYSQNHSLKTLCKEMLNIDLNKEEQTSDWANETLTDAQKTYAASDVAHLHDLRDKLIGMLKREGREKIAKNCFSHNQTWVSLELMGFDDNIFNH